jgi:hypothetical protein
MSIVVTSKLVSLDMDRKNNHISTETLSITTTPCHPLLTRRSMQRHVLINVLGLEIHSRCVWADTSDLDTNLLMGYHRD